MKLEKFVETGEMHTDEYLDFLLEVAGSHRLSKKIEKLIEKLESKKITLPSSDLPDLNNLHILNC